MAPVASACEAILGRLASERRALLAASARAEAALVHGPFDAPAVDAVEDAMRELRFALPRHLVCAEQALYPEVVRAAPEAEGPLRGLVMLHHAAEEALARLQAACVALTVDPSSVGARRRAARGARDLRAALESLFSAVEDGPLSIAKARLDAAAWSRVEGAFAAAALRDSIRAAARP